MPNARRERVRVVTHEVYPEKLQQKIDELNRVMFERRRELKILDGVRDLQGVKANLLRECELARGTIKQLQHEWRDRENKIRAREIAVADREYKERGSRDELKKHREHVLADLATHGAELDRRAAHVREAEAGHDSTKTALQEEAGTIEEAHRLLGSEAKRISQDLEETSGLQGKNEAEARRLKKEREYVNGQTILVQEKMEIMDRGFRELDRRQSKAEREAKRLASQSREQDRRDLELQGRQNDLDTAATELNTTRNELVALHAKLAARSKELGEWEKRQQKRETNLVKRQGKVEAEERRLAEVRRNLTRQAGRNAT